MRYWKLLLILPVFLFPHPALAEEGGGGTKSIFSVGAGSRAISMGGAFSAIGDDPSVLFYNPAALRRNRFPRLMINHIQLFSGFSDAGYDFASVVYPTVSAGSVGLAFMTVGTGGIRTFDEFSRETGEISYRESQGILSYAFNLPWDYFGRFTLGSSVKVLHQRVGDYSDTGTGMDVGFLYDPPFMRGLVLGCNLQDIIGAETKLVSVSERVDRTVMLGAGYRYIFHNGSSLALAAQVNMPRRDDRELRFGAEFRFRKIFSVRFGYDSEQVTAGVGFGLHGFELDYGYFSRNDVGSSHPITLSAVVGSSLDERIRLAEERRKEEGEEYVKKVFAERVSRHIEKARRLRDSDELEKALDELKIALEYDPSNIEAQSLMSELKEAIIARQEERSRSQEKAILINRHFKLGLKYYTNNDLLLARAEWKNVLDLDPENEKAREYLSKTEEKLNENMSVHRLKAKEFEARGMLTAALSEWNMVRMIDPDNKEAVEASKRINGKLEALRREYRATSTRLKVVNLFDEALKAYSNGDYSRAVSLLQSLIKIDPNNTEGRKLLARARRKLTPLTPEEKEKIKGLYIAGMREFTRDNYEKAIEYWQKILEIDPDNGSVLDNIEEARNRIKEMKSGGGRE